MKMWMGDVGKAYLEITGQVLQGGGDEKGFFGGERDIG